MSAACNKAVIMDFGILIQANTQEELPERLLAAVRIHRLTPARDLSFASPRKGPKGGKGSEDEQAATADEGA